MNLSSYEKIWGALEALEALIVHKYHCESAQRSFDQKTYEIIGLRLYFLTSSIFLTIIWSDSSENIVKNICHKCSEGISPKSSLNNERVEVEGK